MSVALIILIALITYLSRAAGLVLLPVPSPRFRLFLDRLPAPLFAGLAALSLLGEQGGPAPAPVVSSMLGALALSPTRSLPTILVGGIIGWMSAVWLLPYLLRLIALLNP
jgi:branched-subunit amino acid transport protein